MEQHREPGALIREAALELARAKSSPCLVFVSCICREDVVPVLDQVGDQSGDELQLLLCSHGGDIDAAFMLTGFLRRRFKKLVVHVPLCARSAATLLCLAADELVVGEIGALGPLDGQWNGNASADHPGSSLLTPFKALEQLRNESAALFEALLDAVVRRTNLRPADAASKAGELTGSLLGQLYGRIDPVALGKAARGLEVGGGYAERVLERWRGVGSGEESRPLVDRLVQGYPSHGFAIDCAEAADLGLPARSPLEVERPLFDRVARALLRCDESVRVIELLRPADSERGVQAKGRSESNQEVPAEVRSSDGSTG